MSPVSEYEELCGVQRTNPKSQKAAASNMAEASNLNKPFCKCPEGWTCEITRTDGPDSGKTFLKCGNGCTCEIGDAGTCKVTEGPTAGEVTCKCPEGWSCVITKTDTSTGGQAFAQCGEGQCGVGCTATA